jgi:hypothetical protein
MECTKDFVEWFGEHLSVLAIGEYDRMCLIKASDGVQQVPLNFSGLRLVDCSVPSLFAGSAMRPSRFPKTVTELEQIKNTLASL